MEEKIPLHEETAAQTASRPSEAEKENPAEQLLPDDLMNSLSHDDHLSDISSIFPEDTPESSSDSTPDVGSAPDTGSASNLVSASDEDALPDDEEVLLPSKKERRVPPAVPVHRWFVTFMCMNIPVIGWLYLFVLALSPSKGPRRDFAKAYLLYKLVFLLLALAILAVAFHYGMEVLDKLLAYMEML